MEKLENVQSVNLKQTPFYFIWSNVLKKLEKSLYDKVTIAGGFPLTLLKPFTSNGKLLSPFGDVDIYVTSNCEEIVNSITEWDFDGYTKHIVAVRGTSPQYENGNDSLLVTEVRWFNENNHLSFKVQAIELNTKKYSANKIRSATDVVNSFDFSASRVIYSHKTNTVRYTPSCAETLKTGFIKTFRPIHDIRFTRVFKYALKGFDFEKEVIMYTIDEHLRSDLFKGETDVCSYLDFWLNDLKTSGMQNSNVYSVLNFQKILESI